MPLSDTTIRGAKAGSRIAKLTDGGGLQLWVTPSGGKHWHLAYRFEGKQKNLTLGSYPAISLADARRRREEAKALLADGIDPAEQKKVEKAQRVAERANTFDALADELIARKRAEGKAERTVAKVILMLSHARPTLGTRPIADVTAADVLAILKRLEAQGKLETARRVRSTIGEVIRLAIVTQRASGDPTVALKGAVRSPRVKHHAAVTKASDLGALLRAIDGFSGQFVTVSALKLLALLFPRPGELRHAEWSEFDLDGAVWTIPASRTKMRREHRVPLPRQAIDILRSLQPVTGSGRLVFPGLRSVLRPISENTLNGALRRLGYSKDDATAHGFRATASTLLNESGLWSVDAIERALAHQEEDAVRRAYARGDHWDERVRMMTSWADRLDALKRGADVVALRRDHA